GDVLPEEPRLLEAAVLRGLHLGREPQQELQLVRREVELLHVAAVPQVVRHGRSPLYAGTATGGVGSGTGGACWARRRMNTFTISSTITSVRAIPIQIHHCEKLIETVPTIRSRNPIAVTAMIASSAIA